MRAISNKRNKKMSILFKQFCGGLAVVCTSLFLGSCARHMDGEQWIGRPVADLVDTLGIPDRKRISNTGDIEYIYNEGYVRNVSIIPTKEYIQCSRVYTIREDQVVNYNTIFNGDLYCAPYDASFRENKV